LALDAHPANTSARQMTSSARQVTTLAVRAEEDVARDRTPGCRQTIRDVNSIVAQVAYTLG
jgi:hypothetical protein